jgi:hypothetical protein
VDIRGFRTVRRNEIAALSRNSLQPNIPHFRSTKAAAHRISLIQYGQKQDDRYPLTGARSLTFELLPLHRSVSALIGEFELWRGLGF